ncbi:MAG TPA: ABC transporter permease subunit [Acidobacteriota bacterium]|nr:ABC transporter permease subunit [Acidobacteriota bacterium]
MRKVFLIAGKELRASVRTLRFVLVLVITLLLFIGATVLGTNRYNLTKNSYELTVRQQAESFAAVKSYEPMLGIFLAAYRPPNPGTLIATGINQLIGDTFYIYNVNNPPALKSPLIHNSFSRLHGDYDMLTIVAIVISFLALLLSYDAFPGEKRDGTAQLLFSEPVGRASIAIGKALGLSLTLFIPIIVSCTASALIAVIAIPGAGDAILGGMAALLILALLYAAVFISLGVAISALTHRPFRSLTALLIIWIALVYVVPEAITAASTSAHPTPTDDDFSNRYREVTIKYLEGFRSFPQDLIERRAAWFELTKWYQGQLRIVWRDIANNLIRQEDFAWAWGWFTPVIPLKLAATGFCGTNPGTEVGSMDSVWDAVVRYDEYLMQKIVADSEEARRTGGGMPRYESGIPWSEIPKVEFRTDSAAQRWGALATGCIVLLAWLVLFTMISILLARRYDPR